jgi:hypothetical protein
MAPAISILFGIGGWLLFVFARRKAARINAWPFTTATIAESRVDVRYSQGSSRRIRRYCAVVRYRYEIDGTTYENDSIDQVGTASSNPERAEETVRKYRPGSTHNLRFNPDRPQESCLENNNSAVLFAAIGTVFFLVGVLLLFR